MAIMIAAATHPKKRLILLDSHAILHRAYHALPDFSTSKGQPTGALYGLSAMLIKIIGDLRPDYIAACYDVKGPTYRHEVYKEYKAGRVKAEDDLIQQIIKSRDIFTALDIPMHDAQGFEADDILGTIVEQLTKGRLLSQGRGLSERERKLTGGTQSSGTHASPAGRRKEGLPGVSTSTDLEIIIASGDMDTLQLVSGDRVRVYTLKKGITDTIMYDEKKVRERFGFGPELIPDYKGLRGDPSDNIPGVKGVGEKTATILITAFGTIENMYKELKAAPPAGGEEKFIKAGITPRIVQLLKDNKEEAEFSKMLATIRRDAPITFTFPDKTFKESVDLKKANAYWSDLEFRTLGQRLEAVVKGKPEIPLPAGRQAGSAATPFKKGDSENTGAHKSPFGKGGSPDPSADGEGSGDFEPGTLTFSSPIPKNDLEKTAAALWVANSSITNPKLEDILNFTKQETFDEAKKAIFAELEKRGVAKVYEDIELPLIPVIHDMEKRGVKVDRALLKKLSKEYHHTLSGLEKKIWKAAGGEFNINSPKQLGEVLFDKLGLKIKNQKKTEGGARSTRESELEKLRDLHPVVPMLFEYRELSKLLSTYIDAIPPLLDADDRLHTHFIQSGSTTGRMASETPNLQNIPIKSELGRAIRHAFIAEKGFKLAALDYSQIELRIAAFLSGDKKLIDIFKKGEDVHTSVAAFVFKVPKAEVTPEMRRQAKVINFGIMYGMGVLALKQNLDTTREEAQRFYNEYFKTFSTLASYLEKIKSETARKGYTETYFGRRRYFEGIKSKIPYIRAQAERMAVNAPIQGTEADVIKLAMIRVQEYRKREGLEEKVFPLLQVHDELVYEIREDIAKKISADIKKIMESVIDPKDIEGIVLQAESAIGDNWGALK